MNTPDFFETFSPDTARDRFLVRDASWDERFRANFNQFLIAPMEFARPVIKLPLPAARTANYALFLVTAGQVELTIGHQAYLLRANDLVVIPAVQIFSLTTIREDTTGFMCFFSNELLAGAIKDTSFGFLKLTSEPLVPLSVAQTSFIHNLLDRLTVEYGESGAAKTDIIHSYLLALLTEINRAYVAKPAQTDVGSRLVQRFMDLLNQHLRQKRLVSEYADLLSVSPNHFNKVVRTRTGKSPSVWIDERIVLEAKVWLFQSDLTVAQIADELGFDDQSNFGKLFRRYTGTSPANFRNRIAEPRTK